MFEFHLVGSGAKNRDDFLYYLSPCGKWLLHDGKVINLQSASVAFTIDEDEAHKGIWEADDGIIEVGYAARGDMRIKTIDLQSGKISIKESDHTRRPEHWEYEGKTLDKKSYITGENPNQSSGYTVYSNKETSVLVNTKTEELLADLTIPIQNFLQGTKQAESTVRGAGIEMTIQHEGTEVSSHQIAYGYQNGPHLYLTFKQNSFFWTGVQGELWLLYYNLETGETESIREFITGLTEPENTVTVEQVRSNGSVLFLTNGTYNFKDLFLYTPKHGIRTLLGKKDRFKGCQRAHIIPDQDEIKLIHHSKAGAFLLRYNNDGELISEEPLDIPYTKTLTKEDWLSPAESIQGYWYFNHAREGGVAINKENWKAVKYIAPAFENFELCETGWFTAIYRNRYYLGYLGVDGLPETVPKVCKLLKAKHKIINAPKADNKKTKQQGFLEELHSINFFDGYPPKMIEKLEGKIRRNKKTHIIEKLQVAGIILEDSYMEQDRLWCLKAGNAYGADRVIYNIPVCAADSCNVERKRDTLHIWFKKGAKEFHFTDLDATNFIPELLAFINFVMPIRKMTAKAYFVEKDKKATILCTQPKAMEHLRDTYELQVTEASRELRA